MTTYSVFSGSFSDEIGQRFLKIMSHAGDTAFKDLYDHSMPHHPKRYRECLDRVLSWENSVISDELERVLREYPDTEQCFKHVYVSYVKAMRGGKTVRLMVSLPKIQEFMHTYYNHFSKHRCVREAHYFQNASLLEQRMTCMDALRDSLFQYLGEEHVKLEGASVISEPISRAVQNAPKSSETEISTHSATSARPSGARDNNRGHDAASMAYRGETERQPKDKHRSDASDVSARSSTLPSEMPPRRPASDHGSAASSRLSSHTSSQQGRDDGASKVISNVFEPEMPSVCEQGEDDDTAIGPDDSVSNIDFATKQHQQIQRFISRRATIEEGDEKSDHSSRTSMSLSSVSISQNGIVPKVDPETRRTQGQHHASSNIVRASFQEMVGPEADERMSEASMREAATSRRRRKSPTRSYVTHLTEDD